jgi:hypothetical protein
MPPYTTSHCSQKIPRCFDNVVKQVTIRIIGLAYSPQKFLGSLQTIPRNSERTCKLLAHMLTCENCVS